MIRDEDADFHKPDPAQPTWADHGRPNPDLTFEIAKTAGLDIERAREDMARPEMQGKSPEVMSRILSAMPALKIRSANIVQLAEQARFLTDIRPIQLTGKAADQINEEARGRLAALLPQLEGLSEWTEPAIKAELTRYCDQNGISMGKIGPVLRVVLTGGAPAPDIALVLALLGRNEAFARVMDHSRGRG